MGSLSRRLRAIERRIGRPDDGGWREAMNPERSARIAAAALGGDTAGLTEAEREDVAELREFVAVAEELYEEGALSISTPEEG